MTEKQQTEQMKYWIDNASYESLLTRWRFASSGNLFFQGEVGDYYAKVMRCKREEVGDAEHTRVSKSIGW